MGMTLALGWKTHDNRHPRTAIHQVLGVSVVSSGVVNHSTGPTANQTANGTDTTRRDQMTPNGMKVVEMP